MDQYFTWIMLVYMLVVYAITRLIRGVVELKRPLWKNSKWWSDISLPTLPIVVGVLFAHWVRSWPFPTVFQASPLREILGGCVGFTSAWGYRIVKAIIKQKWGVDLSEAPPGPAPVVVIPPTPQTPVIVVEPIQEHDNHKEAS